MAELIRNLYVPSGTGRPGVLTNVQLTEVEPDLGRRTSNFVPYSTLYHAVYPRQSASQRRRRKVYKWSVVGALVLLLGVVVVAVALLVTKNTSSVRSRIDPTNSTKIASSSRLTNYSSTLSYITSGKGGTAYITSGKGGTDHITGNNLQDGTKSALTRRKTSSKGLFNIVETC